MPRAVPPIRQMPFLKSISTNIVVCCGPPPAQVAGLQAPVYQSIPTNSRIAGINFSLRSVGRSAGAE
ncbi:MAG TPA: hypothetical protein DER60_07095 [Syntrophomonas sp.]|nr:hypothetical protein [Syntrophomonas sp.]